MKSLPFKLSTFDVVIIIMLVLSMNPITAVSYLLLCWMLNERK